MDIDFTNTAPFLASSESIATTPTMRPVTNYMTIFSTSSMSPSMISKTSTTSMISPTTTSTTVTAVMETPSVTTSTSTGPTGIYPSATSM